MRSASHMVIVTLAILGVVSAQSSAQAQIQDPVPVPVLGPAWANGAPVDVGDLAAGPHSTMEMLYERTIFRVDVLHLTIVLGATATAGIGPVVLAQGYSNEVAASLADTALEARDVLVRTRLLRNLTIRQFLDGTAENLTAAQDGGLISDEERREILAEMEIAWGPFHERGILVGDSIWYRIRGDRVDIVFLDVADGSAPVNFTVVSSMHRRAVLGGYFAPSSNFREKLLRSLFSATPS